jgi:hypothetical protein
MIFWEIAEIGVRRLDEISVDNSLVVDPLGRVWYTGGAVSLQQKENEKWLSQNAMNVML